MRARNDEIRARKDEMGARNDEMGGEKRRDGGEKRRDHDVIGIHKSRVGIVDMRWRTTDAYNITGYLY